MRPWRRRPGKGPGGDTSLPGFPCGDPFVEMWFTAADAKFGRLESRLRARKPALRVGVAEDAGGLCSVRKGECEGVCLPLLLPGIAAVLAGCGECACLRYQEQRLLIAYAIRDFADARAAFLNDSR